MSPVLRRPPRAPHSHQVKPGAQPPGVGKGPEHQEWPVWKRRRALRGAETRQRGTLPATTKPHRLMPSNNCRWVPQTRRARTTRDEPRHEKRFQATPAAVQTDVCTPGSEPSPCRLQNSRRLDGRVRAQGVPSPCRLQTEAVRMDECAPCSDVLRTQHHTRNSQPNTQSEHSGEMELSGPGHRTPNTANRASTPMNESRGARTRYAQHNTPSRHTGEQESSDRGHRTRNTAHRAGTPGNRSQVAQDTAHPTQHTERAHW